MSLTNGLQIPVGVQPVNPVPVDSWSGPYTGLPEALLSIPIEIRFPTMEVRVLDSLGNNKYWFKDGILDSDLVLFGIDMAIITGETYNRISGDTMLLGLITGETYNRIEADNTKFNVTGGTINGDVIVTGGTIHGDGSGLTNIPASGVTGLNLDRITSGTGSAVITSSGLTVNTGVTATEFIRFEGTSQEFLKADGSVDGSMYLTTTGASDTYATINSLTGETYNRTTGYTYLESLITGETYNRTTDDTELYNLITGLTQNKFDVTGGTINGYITASGFTGDGSGLTNIPASGITGLQLDRISSGGNSAIINSSGLTINTGITATNLSGTNTGDERYTNLTPTDSSLGGIPSGSTFSGRTVTQMFDSLLYPTLNPSLANPSSTFSATLSTYYEIGSTISSITFTSSFSRGTISPAYGTSGYRSGLPTQYNYTGSGLISTVTSSLSDSKTITNHTVLVGSNTWSGSVTYLGGEQPLTNKGTNYSSPLSSGTTSVATKTLTGIYPFLYGMNASVLNGSSLYSGLSGKLLEIQGNKTVTLNGSLQYIYFIYPSTYGDLLSIIDNNGFNVTGSFVKTTPISVISSGLGSNWTTNYKVYRTIDQTSVLSGQYQFKFS